MIRGVFVRLMLTGLNFSTKIKDASGWKSGGGKGESSYSSSLMRLPLWDAFVGFF